MVFGSTVLVTVWLSVGVLGFVAGLLWLHAVERSRQSTGPSAGRALSAPATSGTVPEAHEPDA